MTIRGLFLTVFFIRLLLPCISHAQTQNKVMGQVSFTAKTNAEKTAGVWLDGQYVGYVDELKDDKQVLLLPGKHMLSMRQTGYLDSDQEINVDPGKSTVINVKLQKNPKAGFSSVNAQVKLQVTPDRAAVLVDGAFAGTVHDFGGVGRAMLVSPGRHHVEIDLVGHQPFVTDIDVSANQKITIKTDLIPGSVSQASPAIKKP